MTASPAAQPMPGAPAMPAAAMPAADALPGIDPGIEPQPTADGAPPDAAGPLAEERQPPRKRRRKLLLLLLLVGALAGLLAVTIWYLLFRQPITPIPEMSGKPVMPTYVTAAYGVGRPLGVAVTAAGDRLYVGETSGQQTARIIDTGGSQVGLLQPPVSTGGEHVPVYLALDPLTSEVYVSDRPTGSIYVYDAAGTYQRQYQPAAPIEGWQPLALTFDPTGNLYVSDVSATPQRVLEFDRSGKLVRTIGEAAGLSFPNGIAIDPAGNVYVTDSNNGRLLVFATDGSVAAQVGRGVGEGNLGLPRGVAIAGDRVYVADATGQGVFVYGVLQPGSKRLEPLGFFGGEGVANGAFEYPNGIAVDQRGRIYVTDSANNRVQTWSY